MSVFNLGSGHSTAAKNAVAGKDYIVFKDGNGTEYHLLNLDDEKYAPRTGIVEFVPLKTSKRHVNNVNISQYRDVETGLIVGNPSFNLIKKIELCFMPRHRLAWFNG